MPKLTQLLSQESIVILKSIFRISHVWSPRSKEKNQKQESRQERGSRQMVILSRVTSPRPTKLASSDPGVYQGGSFSLAGTGVVFIMGEGAKSSLLGNHDNEESVSLHTVCSGYFPCVLFVFLLNTVKPRSIKPGTAGFCLWQSFLLS